MKLAQFKPFKFTLLVGVVIAFLGLGLSSTATAKDKELNITSDTSGLPAEISDSLARTANAMGVKEPLTISKNDNEAKVSGSNSTVCTIKLSADSAPKILGVNCK